jgi:hypothetical protein
MVVGLPDPSGRVHRGVLEVQNPMKRALLTAVLAAIVLLCAWPASAAITVVTTNKAVASASDPATLDVVLTGVQSGDAIVVMGVCEGTETIAFTDDKATPTTTSGTSCTAATDRASAWTTR